MLLENVWLWAKVGDVEGVTKEVLLATRLPLSAVGHKIPLPKKGTWNFGGPS